MHETANPNLNLWLTVKSVCKYTYMKPSSLPRRNITNNNTFTFNFYKTLHFYTYIPISVCTSGMFTD